MSNGRWKDLSNVGDQQYSSSLSQNSLFVAAGGVSGRTIAFPWGYQVLYRSFTRFLYSKYRPGGTAVPDWAYQDVSGTDAFNETLAADVATTDHSESISSTSPSSTSTTSPTSSSVGVPSDKGSRTAIIVGGVIGGLIGLSLLAVVILFFIRRRRHSRMAPSTAYLEANRSKEDTASRGRYMPVDGSKANQGVPDLPYNIVVDDDSSFSFNPYDPSLTTSEKKSAQ
ncbi:hypothetical protein EV368DRAFT_83341 [Lentinula lateritia]|nr:hypothetical protein EV368DRAFT_83341 [Lentinula lateritia]